MELQLNSLHAVVPICLPDTLAPDDIATQAFVHHPRRAPRFSPSAPGTLAETGLAASLIEQLLLKILYTRAETSVSNLVHIIGLNFTVIEEIKGRLIIERDLFQRKIGIFFPDQCGRILEDG